MHKHFGVIAVACFAVLTLAACKDDNATNQKLDAILAELQKPVPPPPITVTWEIEWEAKLRPDRPEHRRCTRGGKWSYGNNPSQLITVYSFTHKQCEQQVPFDQQGQKYTMDAQVVAFPEAGEFIRDGAPHCRLRWICQARMKP
ncbi:MAG: hypothetical protein PsegKO_36390 [Pseudohongiellaceae bacterium]